ncbi:VanW family protein [Intrasporangium mesophilum]
MPDSWQPEPRRENRSTALRLLVAGLVLGGGYAALCIWASGHVPATVTIGGIHVGGMSPDQAGAAIERGSETLLSTPIALSVPGREEPVQVVPSTAGFQVDIRRSLDGLTGFTLSPSTVWSKLTGSVEAPLLTSVDDDRLTAYLGTLAPRVAVAATEGGVSFPGGMVTVALPRPGQALDVAGTKLALRKAFPNSDSATAAMRAVDPAVGPETVQQVADEFGRTAMSGPVTVVAGTAKTQLSQAEFAPMVSLEPDGAGSLRPAFDEKGLAALVAKNLNVPSKAAQDARWVFAPNNGRPRLVPSVDGSAVDQAAVGTQVAAAIGSGNRTVTVKPVVTKPKLTTEQAQKAGITTLVVDFKSPFPTNDKTRTNNLVVATRTINGTYVPPGGTFSLNGVLGERTEDKGYADGTVIINGRLTRGTGGGVSQVSTVIYNMAYFAGADILEFTPHAFFIPRYPEGREATVYWPSIDNKWKNDTSFGMLLQTWVEDGYVHGRVWSTKVWDITSVKGPRRNVVPPERIVIDGLKCYPQQPNPGFVVTVTRQWYKPGSSALVKKESVTTRYRPEDEIVCTNPNATPP